MEEYIGLNAGTSGLCYGYRDEQKTFSLPSFVFIFESVFISVIGLLCYTFFDDFIKFRFYSRKDLCFHFVHKFI